MSMQRMTKSANTNYLKLGLMGFTLCAASALSVVANAASPTGDRYCLNVDPIAKVQRSTPNSRFDVDAANDSLITDLQTGLMWDRCSYNLDFDARSGNCVKAPDGLGQGGYLNTGFTWQMALENVVNAANDANYKGYSDWRVPNAKELASIVERSCVNPAINNTAFPDTLSASYWTNTPMEVVVNGVKRLQPFSVSFVDGQVLPLGADNPGAIRLVREATPAPVN